MISNSCNGEECIVYLAGRAHRLLKEKYYIFSWRIMTAKRIAKGSLFFFFFAFNSFGSYSNSWEKIPIKSNMVLGHFKYETAYTTGTVNFDLMGTEEADCWVGTEPFFGITPTLFRKTMPKKLEIFKECFLLLKLATSNQIWTLRCKHRRHQTFKKDISDFI